MPLLKGRKPLRIKPLYINTLRFGVHIISTVWVAYIYYMAITGTLPGDPVQYLIDFTGIGALNLLLLSLCVTPLSSYFKMQQAMVLRKTLGVYAALYALIHVSVFVVFELQFEWQLILSEIIKRPYITVGFVALCILTALLVTSFQRVKLSMGRAWQNLHNLVYVALFLGALHYIWSIKSTEVQPIIYMALSLLILVTRRHKIQNMFKK